jgi:hypothetical protein
MHADAWRDADPQRQTTAALHALAAPMPAPATPLWPMQRIPCCPYSPVSPLTHSPAAAATASRPRRTLDPGQRPAVT